MRYFIVKSDHHIVEAGSQLEGVDTAARARAVVEKICSEQVPVECVIDLGDVADTVLNPRRAEAEASREAYNHAAEVLAPLNDRTLYIPGNHDTPEFLYERLGNRWSSSRSGCMVHELAGLTLIGVDFRTGPIATGELREETAFELSKALEKSGRCVIVSHYPWRPCDNAWLEANGRITNRERVAEILSPHRDKILGAFYGHLHTWWTGTHAGMPMFGCGGSAGAFTFEPGSAPHHKDLAEPFGYYLVGYDDQGALLVRPRFVRT
jgi:3',5'-cyclic AMP phosphodiesterase CpdA